nr:MAG TPA: hypothetical protein [Inoviridae sp.]
MSTKSSKQSVLLILIFYVLDTVHIDSFMKVLYN